MFDALDRWLRLSAERIHDQARTLTVLDQAIGDGDHGINMDRGFAAILVLLDGAAPDVDGDVARAGTALRTAGRTLISTVGGAAGPLYGTAFVRAGNSLVGADSSTSNGELLLAAFEASIGGIAGLGKATTGEQ